MSPEPTCDLHIHTYYSDGAASPQEVLAHAASLGLRALAVADHDTAGGSREALSAASEFGIDVVPAIEFTCHWDRCTYRDGRSDIDVLGYLVDLDDSGFQAFERAALADMHARVAECCAHLTRAGYPVTLDDVFAENPRYAGALQLNMALLHAGYAQGHDGAFALFNEYYGRVRSCRSTIDEVIAAVRAAGGVAVLAHPAECVSDGRWLDSGHIAALVEMGLDGLEAYHRRLDAAARAHFLALAQQFDLVVTGGSDEHGPAGSMAWLGSEPWPATMVEALRERRRQRG